MKTHQAGLFVVYCAPELAKGPAASRQTVPVTSQECHNISNGNREAPVGIANILSRVLLLLQVTGWLMELVQRIIFLIILSLIGEVQVGCLAWMLCTCGFVCGNGDWSLSWSMCAVSSVPNSSVWLSSRLSFPGVVFSKVINGTISASGAWVGILIGRWWNCTNKKDPLQSRGRGFKKHDSCSSVSPARRHLIYYFSFIVWFLSDQCNSCGLKNSTCKGKKVLHYMWGNVPVSSQ